MKNGLGREVNEVIVFFYEWDLNLQFNCAAVLKTFYEVPQKTNQSEDTYSQYMPIV